MSMARHLLRAPTMRKSVVAERLKAYEQQTLPLVDYYRSTGRLVEVEWRSAGRRGDGAGVQCDRECQSFVSRLPRSKRCAAADASSVRFSRRREKQSRQGVSTMDLERVAEAQDQGTGREAGIQGLLRLSLRAVHLGERRDRSRHSVGTAGAEGRRHRLHRLRRGAGRVLRRFGDHGAGRRRVTPELQKLLEVTRESLDDGIEAARDRQHGRRCWRGGAASWWRPTASA